MVSAFDLDWYVAVTFPKGEERAKRNLERHGIAAWVPTYSRVVKQAGHRRFVTRMLVPSYVFLGFEPGRERWDPVRAVDAIWGMVSTLNGTAVRLRRDEVGKLMCACFAGRYDLDERRRGAKVKILGGGEHADLVGRVVATPEPDRLLVLIKGLGETAVVEKALDEVALAA